MPFKKGFPNKLLKFLCLYFGFESVPKIVRKLLDIPVVILRRINIRIIIYLDSMLLMSREMVYLKMVRKTLNFLLQQLDFAINPKKSLLSPTQSLGFPVLEIDSHLSRSKSKEIDFKTSLIGTLCSTVQAVLPAFLQMR